jgi:hypothetical protein
VPAKDVIAAKIILCESVLTEETGLPSAIRILDMIGLSAGTSSIHFFAITNIHYKPLDFAHHVLSVRLVRLQNGQWNTIAAGDDYGFSFGHRHSLTAPGSVVLTTEFNLPLAQLGELGTFYIQAWLDGEMVTHTPITLRRAG